MKPIYKICKIRFLSPPSFNEDTYQYHPFQRAIITQEVYNCMKTDYLPPPVRFNVLDFSVLEINANRYSHIKNEVSLIKNGNKPFKMDSKNLCPYRSQPYVNFDPSKNFGPFPEPLTEAKKYSKK